MNISLLFLIASILVVLVAAVFGTSTNAQTTYPPQTTRAGTTYPPQTTRAGTTYPPQTTRAGTTYPPQTTRAGTTYPPQTTRAGTTYPPQTTQNFCHPFNNNGREVFPSNWIDLYQDFTFNNTETGRIEYFSAGISLCRTIPYFTIPPSSNDPNPNPGFIILQNFTQTPGSFYSTDVYDAFVDMRTGDHGRFLYFDYALSTNRNHTFHIDVVCNPYVQTLRVVNNSMMHYDKNGYQSYSIVLETERMCPGGMTTQPPTTAAPIQTSTTAANAGCESFYVGNNLVWPQTWGMVTGGGIFTYVDPVTGAMTEFDAAIDPCNKIPSFTLPPSEEPFPSPSYAYTTNRTRYPGNGFRPETTFDIFSTYEIDGVQQMLSRTYISGEDPLAALELRTFCNKSATSLRFRNFTFTSVFRNGFIVYVFEAEIDKMCGSNPATTFPPTTTSQPRPMPSSIPCAPIALDGKIVDPNVAWNNAVYSTLDINQLPGTSAYVVGDICKIVPSFTRAGESNFPGYFMIAPDANYFYSGIYDVRQLEEVNQVAQFVKYKYTSVASNNALIVYIHCDPNIQTLVFQPNTGLSYFENVTSNSFTFTVHLVSNAICPVQTTTSIAPAQCKSFDWLGHTFNPTMWPPTQGILKNLMSGEAATVLLDLCDMHHFTASPSLPFKPGYLVLLPFHHDDWPQVSFDIIDSFDFIPGSDFELRINYRSSQSNHTQDRARIIVRCGGGSGLSFADRYILPVRNPEGGVTYTVPVQTQLMCVSGTKEQQQQQQQNIDAPPKLLSQLQQQEKRK